MPDEKVDGFSDVAERQEGSGEHDPHDEIPGSPDPGVEEGALEPLDPEERAELEKEIREGDQEGHHGHVPDKE